MSFKKFNFNNHIQESLQRLGYTQPTPIQQKAIQPVLDGRDLLGLAQTGTGKTAAFILPILQYLSNNKSRGQVRALIISPTRELAEQTSSYIEKFSNRLNLRSCVVYGGVSKAAQVNKLKKGVEVVVACPGRLLDLSNCGQIDLSKVGILVLDEADQMFDQGFLPDIRRIINQLPRERQNLVFSATMPREVRSLVEGMLTNPVEVKIDYEKPIENISHTIYQVENRDKNKVLQSILKRKETQNAIVFTRTKYKAKNLALKLAKGGFKATSLQGNLSQNQRQQALDGFKTGVYDVLVATDIAARGIDVAGISHVINFDMPGTLEAYTHRTGRTGRASKSGQAYTFSTREDQKMVGSLKRALNGNLSLEVLQATEKSSVANTVKVEKKKEPRPPQRPVQKRRGKRSSQRNRAASFDFGI